jgi:hypothetical protein
MRDTPEKGEIESPLRLSCVDIEASPRQAIDTASGEIA